MSKPRQRAAHLGEIKDPFSGKFVVVVFRDGYIGFKLKGSGQMPRYLTLMEAYSMSQKKPLVEQL